MVSDFPGILSGDQVGFLDPHESCFTYRENEHAPKQHTSSQCWKLSNPDLKSELRDQVEPFLHKLFGSEDCLETEEFNGTVFRFPLRQNSAQSHLCKTVYDNDKVYNLFRMFEKEAHLFLLFLNNIETIEVYVKQNRESEPEPLMSVKINNRDAIDKRNEFRERVAEFAPERLWMPEPLSSTYRMTTLFESFDPAKPPSSKSWLVTQYYDGGLSPAEPFISSEKSKFLPWMGAALELGEVTTCSGQIFCFLPLPQLERSPTALNFHVNGYFAVSQDRCASVT